MCDFWHVLYICFSIPFDFLLFCNLFLTLPIGSGSLKLDYFKASLNMSLPLMQRWGSSHLSSIRHDLQTYLEHLNSLQWDIQQYDFMAAIMSLETMRVLLPRYDCQIWYLGERMYHWHLGPSRRHVPSPIPSSML